MRIRLTRPRVALLAVGAAAVVAGTAGSLGSAHAASGRQAIPNTRPAWLGHAKNLGHASARASVSARIYLAPNGGMAKLEQFALAVSTPGNAQYRHFLKPSRYFQRFGTTNSTVSAVKSWLTGAGLHVTGVERHNRYVEIGGTVAAAEKAFGVSINRYQHNGLTVQAPTAGLSAPAGVASSVLTVLGVDTTPLVVRPATQKPPPPEPGFRNAGPCSTYYGEKLATTLPAFNGHILPYAPCGYVGTQFRSAYEGATTLDGSGVTVAITDAYASPNIATDAATYASLNGDLGYGAGQLSQSVAKPFTRVNQGLRQCDASGWYGEETLDVEAVHAMAPGRQHPLLRRVELLRRRLPRHARPGRRRERRPGRHQLVGRARSRGRSPTDTSPRTSRSSCRGAAEGSLHVLVRRRRRRGLATGAEAGRLPHLRPVRHGGRRHVDRDRLRRRLAWQTGWGTQKYSLSAAEVLDPLGFLYGAGGG